MIDLSLDLIKGNSTLEPNIIISRKSKPNVLYLVSNASDEYLSIVPLMLHEKFNCFSIRKAEEADEFSINLKEEPYNTLNYVGTCSKIRAYILTPNLTNLEKTKHGVTRTFIDEVSELPSILIRKKTGPDVLYLVLDTTIADLIVVPVIEEDGVINICGCAELIDVQDGNHQKLLYVGTCSKVEGYIFPQELEEVCGIEELTKGLLSKLFKKHCLYDGPGELILIKPKNEPDQLYAVQQFMWDGDETSLLLGGPLEEDENHNLKGFTFIRCRDFSEGWLFAGIAKVHSATVCTRVSWK